MRAVTLDVPGYRLGEQLGAGSTGVVYEAVREADDQPVAVKVVHPELVDPQYLDRLRHEARLASAVVHPGVVRVHEVGGEGDRAWLVMDRLSGPDLQRLLDQEGAVPPARAAQLMAQVADAIDAVHQAGVIHRDLKPGNIILDHGDPLVGDFGVARQLVTLESSTGLDLTGSSDWIRSGIPGSGSGAGSTPTSGPTLGAMAGTVAYMAPEQWRGEEVSPATDVYALGGTLFALLTGRRPFDRRTLPGLAYAVAILPPPAPSAYDVPAAFDEVVATAMAKEPGDRYPSAAAFADAVRAVSSGASGPASGPSRLRRRMRVLAVAVPAVLVGGIGTSVLVAQDRDSSGGQLVVCAEDATVRDAPRSKTVIATVHRGDRLHLTSVREGESWVNVRLPDGRTGWSLRDFVRYQC